MNLFEQTSQHLAEIQADFLARLSKSDTLEQLLALDTEFLSKKGKLSQALQVLRQASAEDRPKIGAVANEVKRILENAYIEKRTLLEAQALNIKLMAERLDSGFPGRGTMLGARHPISIVMDELVSIFSKIGFELAEGPEVDTEFNNFEALNMADDHPARDMQDTFYLPDNIKSNVVMRTHTSPVQIRSMLARKKPPVRVICPGAVFRSDYDMTHTPMFHQIEGLYVDANVSFAELRGALEFFAIQMFGPQTKTRVRPSYFPFVEPGAEVDVTCFNCAGKGCRVCKETGWLEILGGGMVHRKVFEAVGYDADEVSGFAFGMGIERIAMLKFGIPDLRTLYENDVRFLRQFSGL